jgi:Protein of unknown function (DUF732)
MFTYAQLKKLAVMGIGASALGLAAGIAAQTAHADNGSDFIAALASRNIVPLNGNSGTIENGRAACDELNSGRSQASVAAEWYRVDKANGLSQGDAAFMTSMAIKYFCPNAG